MAEIGSDEWCEALIMRVGREQNVCERRGLKETANLRALIRAAVKEAEHHICLDPKHPDCVVLLRSALDALVGKMKAAEREVERLKLLMANAGHSWEDHGESRCGMRCMNLRAALREGSKP